LVREGYTKYALTAGRFRSSSEQYLTPAFVQGSLKRGLSGGVTVYGGVQYSDQYRAASAGGGINLARIGAVSADITHAESTLSDGSRHQGQSVRFLYSWFLGATDTTFNLAGYRYSTQGFHTLDETALKGMRGWLYDYDRLDENGQQVKRPYNEYYNLYSARKGRLEASISQKVGALGSLYLSGSRENYWNGRGATEAWQAGFSSHVGAVNYSLGWRYQKSDQQSGADQSVSLFMSVPLNTLFRKEGASVFATFNVSEDNRGGMDQQAGLNGNAMEDNKLNWSLSQGYSRYGKETGNASLAYQGDHGSTSLGYGYSRNYQTVNYGFSGGVLLHRDGLTLGQQFTDGAVLISAPDAAGSRVNNSSGIHLDARGYAIGPGISPYRESQVSLDVTTLPDDVDSDGASHRVVPTRGAIVRVDFKTKQGLRALMTLTQNGKPLPFGAIVSAAESSGIVGDEGLVYLAGLKPQGTLKAQWGHGAEQRCTVHYQVPATGETSDVVHLTGNCR
jgi:outer membrane usher protein